jgi:hypothetical protein
VPPARHGQTTHAQHQAHHQRPHQQLHARAPHPVPSIHPPQRVVGPPRRHLKLPWLPCSAAAGGRGRLWAGGGGDWRAIPATAAAAAVVAALFLLLHGQACAAGRHPYGRRAGQGGGTGACMKGSGCWQAAQTLCMVQPRRMCPAQPTTWPLGTYKSCFPCLSP